MRPPLWSLGPPLLGLILSLSPAAAAQAPEDSVLFKLVTKGWPTGLKERFQEELSKDSAFQALFDDHLSSGPERGAARRRATGPGVGIRIAAASTALGFKSLYAFPNPARRNSRVTFRVQPGLADTIDLRVYDVAGRKIYSTSNFVSRGLFDDGNGAGQQYTFENVWDISGIASGIYSYSVVIMKNGERDQQKDGKVAVVK